MNKLPSTVASLNPQDNNAGGAESASHPNTESAGTPDPFDPERYRVRPDGEPGSGVEVQPSKIPVRDKPKKADWFRSSPIHTLRVHVLEHEVGMDKERYLVTPEVAVVCVGEVREMDLHLRINRDGGLFILSLPAPNTDGTVNTWTESKRAAINTARSTWVRLKSDKPNQQWRCLTTKLVLAEPNWPDVPMRNILERAFGKERLIDNFDHPLLKVLRGEA